MIFVLYVSPDVKVVGSKSFVQSVGEMTKKTNALYNSKLDLIGSSRSFPVDQSSIPSDGYLQVERLLGVLLTLAHCSVVIMRQRNLSFIM
jgi:hypothetical protein